MNVQFIWCCLLVYTILVFVKALSIISKPPHFSIIFLHEELILLPLIPTSHWVESRHNTLHWNVSSRSDSAQAWALAVLMLSYSLQKWPDHTQFLLQQNLLLQSLLSFSSAVYGKGLTLSKCGALPYMYFILISEFAFFFSLRFTASLYHSGSSIRPSFPSALSKVWLVG